MKTEQQSAYCIYSRNYSQSQIPNIVTDPITERQLLSMAKDVISFNKRYQKLQQLKAELAQKHGLVCKDNTQAWRKAYQRKQQLEANKPAQTMLKCQNMAQLASQAKNVLITQARGL